jgi:hypothetical protein
MKTTGRPTVAGRGRAFARGWAEVGRAVLGFGPKSEENEFRFIFSRSNTFDMNSMNI